MSKQGYIPEKGGYLDGGYAEQEEQRLKKIGNPILIGQNEEEGIIGKIESINKFQNYYDTFVQLIKEYFHPENNKEKFTRAFKDGYYNNDTVKVSFKTKNLENGKKLYELDSIESLEVDGAKNTIIKMPMYDKQGNDDGLAIVVGVDKNGTKFISAPPNIILDGVTDIDSPVKTNINGKEYSMPITYKQYEDLYSEMILGKDSELKITEISDRISENFAKKLSQEDTIDNDFALASAVQELENKGITSGSNNIAKEAIEEQRKELEKYENAQKQKLQKEEEREFENLFKNQYKFRSSSSNDTKEIQVDKSNSGNAILDYSQMQVVLGSLNKSDKEYLKESKEAFAENRISTSGVNAQNDRSNTQVKKTKYEKSGKGGVNNYFSINR